MCRGKPKEKWAAHPARVRRFGIRKELVEGRAAGPAAEPPKRADARLPARRAGGLRPDARLPARRAGGLRPDARILQGVDEDGKGDVPCAENCGWMVPT